MSRTRKTVINSFVGVGCSLISSILSFVLQAVFIRLMGLEYSGVNGLFTSVLNILNLAELGINNAIFFRLYKHIADNNKEEIEKILFFYKKSCYFIGAVILFVGLCLVPFLDFFVKEKPIFSESLWSLYIIVLLTSVVTQILNYKSALIVAKQDRYILTVVNYLFIFLKHILQLVVLWLFKNIYIYLLIALVTSIFSGVVTGAISKKKYDHSFNSTQKLSRPEKKDFVKDVGSLSVYKICRTIDASVDTFLISKFVSTSVTAIYGSISMLLNALNELLGCFNDGVIASVGDVYASGDKIKTKQIFYQSYHITYLIYGVCTATLIPVLKNFTDWWIGYTLDTSSIYIMLINFYMYGFGMTVATFRNSMGVFKKGWYRPAVTAVLNLIVSLLLIQRIGLIGTLIGTLVSRTLTLVWFDPLIIFKQSFGETPWKYYFRYIVYAIFTALTCLLTLTASNAFSVENNILYIIIQGLVCFVISCVCLSLLGSVFSEQRDTFMRFKNIFLTFINKNKG